MIRSFAFASFVFGQTEAVLADNSWTEWEAITDCTADCITQNIGTLINQRSRLNYNVDDLNNSTIPEIENKTEICTADSYCPKWSLWENAPTPCSATCGGGSQSQIRRCLNGVIGQFGCQGPVQQLVRCNEDPCPSWSSWSIDYEGGQSCGPFCRMTKTRSCGVEGSERSILAQIPLPCPGPAKLETGCTPCGSWSEWSEVECSETCGEGKMVIERECLTEEGNELEIILNVNMKWHFRPSIAQLAERETVEGNYADDCPGQSVKVEDCKISDCSTSVSSTSATTPSSTKTASSESMNTTLPAIKTTTSSTTTTNTRFVPPTVSLLSPTPPQNIETLLAEDFHCEQEWEKLRFWDGWKCVKFFQNPRPWAYANRDCKSEDSHLPVPHSSFDQYQFYNLVRSARLPLRATWLGLKRNWDLTWVEDHSRINIVDYGYDNWQIGYPDPTDFYAAMRQSDGLWSSGIGKASLRFFCLKNASEIQLIDLDEPLITADALLTVLDNLLESNPEEIDLEEIVVQAASDATAAPKSSSTTTTEKKPITESTRTSPTSQTQSRISVTSSIETKNLPATTEAEETNLILHNPDSETTPSPDMIFDTTFVAEELATNFEIASEEDLLPAFLQPTTQEETSTVLTVARTREANKSAASEITFSILCCMILLSL